MSGVIIEELDNSSDEEFRSAGGQSKENEDDEDFYACDEDCEMSNGKANDATRRAQMASAIPDEGPSSAAAKIADQTQQITAADGVLKPEKEPLSAVEEKDLAQAEKLKLEGNTLYGTGQYIEALDTYKRALELAPDSAAQQRAVYLANSAAAHIKLEQFAEAAKDCGAALALQPPESLQVKALTRRSGAYEKLDDLERALLDYEKLVELDPKNASSQAAVRRLKPIVEERREKMKNEMIDKLKDLGNTVLGKFGMSLDNFKAVKDPRTGSYSINFQQ